MTFMHMKAKDFLHRIFFRCGLCRNPNVMKTKSAAGDFPFRQTDLSGGGTRRHVEVFPHILVCFNTPNYKVELSQFSGEIKIVDLFL